MSERWVRDWTSACKRSKYGKHSWRMIDINDLHSTYCWLCMKRAYSLVTEEVSDV